jgi:hypothetical protein
MRTIVPIERAPAAPPSMFRFPVVLAGLIALLLPGPVLAQLGEMQAYCAARNAHWVADSSGGRCRCNSGYTESNDACVSTGGGVGGVSLPSSQLNMATELGTIFGRALGEALRGKSAAERQAEAAAAAEAQRAQAEAARLRAEELARLQREAEEAERRRVEAENRRLEGIRQRLTGSLKGQSSGLTFKGMKTAPLDDPKPEKGGLKFKLGDAKVVERPRKTGAPAESWEVYKKEVLDRQRSLTRKDPSNKETELWCKGHVPLSMTSNRGPWEERCNPGGEVKLAESVKPPKTTGEGTASAKPAAPPAQDHAPAAAPSAPSGEAAHSAPSSGGLAFKLGDDAPRVADPPAADPAEQALPAPEAPPVADAGTDTNRSTDFFGAGHAKVTAADLEGPAENAAAAAKNAPPAEGAGKAAPSQPGAGTVDPAPRQKVAQTGVPPAKARLDEKAGSASGPAVAGTAGKVTVGYSPDGAAIAGGTPSLLAGGKVLRVLPSGTPAKSLTPSEYGVDGRGGYSESYESFWPKETPVDKLLAKWDVIRSFESMQKTARGVLNDQGTVFAKNDLPDRATDAVVGWLKRARGSAAIIDRAFSAGEASNILERYTEGVKDDVLGGIEAASRGNPEPILDSMDLEAKRRGDLKQEVAELVMGETGASVDDAKDVLAEKADGRFPSSVGKIKSFEASSSCHWFDTGKVGLGCSARFTH